MAVGTDKRLLRHIFRIFSLSQDAERHANGQRGGIRQSSFELAAECVLHDREGTCYRIQAHGTNQRRTAHLRPLQCVSDSIRNRLS